MADEAVWQVSQVTPAIEMCLLCAPLGGNDAWQEEQLAATPQAGVTGAAAVVAEWQEALLQVA
jgi:hypothetical protein